MTSFDPWADYDAVQEEAEKGGSYTPLPAGPRDFNLYEATEVVPFAKDPNSPYAGLFALKVQLRVPDGAEFANRRIFTRVPLFPKSPPVGKELKQYVQYEFFGFFQKALGWDADKLKGLAGKIREGNIEAVSAALRPELGKLVRASLKVTPPDNFNPEGGNEVKSWAAASGAGATVSNVPSDAWAAAPSTPAATPEADVWATSTPKEDPAFAAAASSSQGF